MSRSNFPAARSLTFILYNTCDSRMIKLTEKIFVRTGEAQALNTD